VVKTSISARSPLSPTRSPRNGFVWWQSLLLLVLVFFEIIVVAAFVFGLAIGFGAASIRDLTTLSWPVLIGQLAGYAVALATIAWLLPPIARRSLTALGLRAPRITDLLWAIVGTIGMMTAAELAAWLQGVLFHLKSDEVAVHWLRSAHGPILVGFAFLACVAAPFFEELVFRGFVFNAFLRYMPAWGAALFSSILFGLVHWQRGNEGAIIPLAASGIVLAVVYYRTGSLPASMLTHGLFNSATFFAVTVLHQKP
jgi:membrane protease YdiL (CAAX protease family)